MNRNQVARGLQPAASGCELRGSRLSTLRRTVLVVVAAADERVGADDILDLLGDTPNIPARPSV